jgi:flagellar biosynthesis chaperone FliJ
MKTENIFKAIEKNIDLLIRDDRFINVVSTNLNTLLKIQDYTHQKLESILRIVDVPTIKSMDHLFNSINMLEKTIQDQSKKINHLEEKIQEMNSKPKRVRTVKT